LLKAKKGNAERDAVEHKGFEPLFLFRVPAGNKAGDEAGDETTAGVSLVRAWEKGKSNFYLGTYLGIVFTNQSLSVP